MKDAYWFKHDSNARNDEKIIDLRGELGYEGYGIYWALIEFLRDTENYEADYKPKRLALALTADEGLLEQVINGYGLFVVDESGKFYSESLKTRMKQMDLKREQQRDNANKRWEKEKKDKANESHGNATALLDYSHKKRKDNSRSEEIILENRTQDERVQGEKADHVFFTQCLKSRNAPSVMLLFEYLFFASVKSFEKIEDTRSNFLDYWKDLKLDFNMIEIKKRLNSMANIGFELMPEQKEIQFKLFFEKQKQDKIVADHFTDFLIQLKKSRFKPTDRVISFIEFLGVSH
jgi:hypothetical protein